MGRSRICLVPSVCCSDTFSALSFEAQVLYYRINFESDQMGALTNTRAIMKAIGVSEAALQELIDAGFIQRCETDFDKFDLITHFWVNNKLDRMNQIESIHQDTFNSKFAFQSDRMRVYVPVSRLAELGQTGCSLQIVFKRKEEKRNEKNGIERKRVSSEAPTPSKLDADAHEDSKPQTFMVQCPKCSRKLIAVPEGGFLHGECPEHADFFVDCESGEVI